MPQVLATASAHEEGIKPRHVVRNVAAHISAGAFIAFIAHDLLFRSNFIFDGDFFGWINWWPVFGQTNFGCEAPLHYIYERRQSDVFAAAVCWDAAHDRVRIAAMLLTLMVAAWAARSIARLRGRRGRPYALAFVVVGLVALVGDEFRQWPWGADLLNV